MDKILSPKETIILSTVTDFRKSNSKPNLGLTKELLEELIYKDNLGNNLTAYNCVQKSDLNFYGNGAIQFLPDTNRLNVVIDKMLSWVDLQCRSFLDNPDVSSKEYNDLYYYLYFGVIMHEISHSKQYLIAFEDFEIEFEELRAIYKEVLILLLSKLLNEKSIIPFVELLRLTRIKIYKKKEDELVLERNAHVESFGSLVDVADADNELLPTVNNLLNDLYTKFLLGGYKTDRNRIISPCEKTLTTILKKGKLNRIEFTKNGSLLGRLSYGLPISDFQFHEIRSLQKEFSNKPIELKNKIYTLSNKH